MTTTQTLPQLSLDEYGLLQHPEHWNHDVALHIAQQLEIKQLSEDHWIVINALRNHYEKFSTPPAIHHICHAHHQDDYWIHNLFDNYFNAWRVAGLPDPGEEAIAYMNDM